MTVSGVPERVWDNRSKQADDGQKVGLDNSSTPWAECPGRGRGGVPLKAGVGVLHGNMHTLHALRPEASVD